MIITREVTGSARRRTLLLHRHVKPGFIDFQLALTRDIGGQIQREAIGVVQFKGRFTRNGVTFQVGNRIVQNRHALIQGFGELLFFQPQDFLHMLCQISQFRISFAHLLDQRRHQLVEETGRRPQHMTMTHSATDNAAQYVTTAFIRW